VRVKFIVESGADRVEYFNNAVQDQKNDLCYVQAAIDNPEQLMNWECTE